MGSVPSAVVKPAVIVPPPSASSNTTLPDDEVLSHGSSYSSATSTSVLTSPTSCTYIFDSLWFCLSPVYQAKEYYISGDFDACEDKASALYMCLANKVGSKSLQEWENGRWAGGFAREDGEGGGPVSGVAIGGIWKLPSGLVLLFKVEFDS